MNWIYGSSRIISWNLQQQGYAREQLACAAAAASSQGSRKKHLEGDCEQGKQSRSARRNEKLHGSGKGSWKQHANSFKSGLWYSSQWTGIHHRCILEQRSEHSRNRKSEKLVRTKLVFAETWPKTRWCSVKNQAVLSSRWTMWSWLSWRNPRFDVHHVYITFLRAHSFASTENRCHPTKRNEPA